MPDTAPKNYEFACEWADPFSGETHQAMVIGFVRPQDAAIHAISKHEWDMAEFPIAAGRERVTVTVQTEDGTRLRYEVSGNSAPRYFAVPLPAISAAAAKETTHA